MVALLHDMNALARRLQKRRLHQGQIVLDLPEVELVLDEEGKIVDAVPEDQSFTHTLIEMFMVEANEAVARLLDSMNVPFIRRIHPSPEVQGSERLRRKFSSRSRVFKLPKVLDRKSIQSLLNGGAAANRRPSPSISRCSRASTAPNTRPRQSAIMHWPANTIATSHRPSADTPT